MSNIISPEHSDGPDPHFGRIANHKTLVKYQVFSQEKLSIQDITEMLILMAIFAWQLRHGSISPEPESLSGG